MEIIITLVMLAIGLAVSFFVIRAAVVGALRKARREAFVERTAPENAEWLPGAHRRDLRQDIRGASSSD